VTSYPAGMTMSNRTLIMLSDALRQRRTQRGTRWRRLPAGEQALLVVAHLRKGETYTDLAVGFGIGTTTVFRYVREALDVLATMAPTLDEAIDVARRKGVRHPRRHPAADRPGCHDLRPRQALLLREAQVPWGERPGHRRPGRRLIWASPALSGARHDMGAAAEHGILDALQEAGVPVVADKGYQGAGPTVHVPQRRRRLDRDTGRYRPLSQNQKDVNAAHARQRGPGERANAQLKSWKILRRIRSCPTRATELVNAVQVLILAA
jgi:DDE superfamily endonuclease/Helix-turn-helix of DDE superfamily endonuclease